MNVAARAFLLNPALIELGVSIAFCQSSSRRFLFPEVLFHLEEDDVFSNGLVYSDAMKGYWFCFKQ